jgi:hypothetical protein
VGGPTEQPGSAIMSYMGLSESAGSILSQTPDILTNCHCDFPSSFQNNSERMQQFKQRQPVLEAFLSTNRPNIRHHIVHILTLLLRSWSSALLDKPLVAQLLKNLSYFFWNPKFDFYVHMSLSLLPISSLINPVNTVPSYLRSVLILSSLLHLDLPTSLFPLAFLQKYRIHSFSHRTCYMPDPSHSL